MIRYEDDVILWAEEQARLLRNGQFSQLDIEHLADEIEDVGKSEKRELASRMAVLVAHLLKWRRQPERRGRSWRQTIITQRKRVALALKETSSLKASLATPEWREDMWLDARNRALEEIGLETLPDACPWTMEQVMDQEFWPDEG